MTDRPTRPERPDSEAHDVADDVVERALERLLVTDLSDDAWRAWRESSRGRDDAWRRLAESLRDELHARALVESALLAHQDLAPAPRTSVAPDESVRPATVERAGRVGGGSFRRLALAAGWLLALVLGAWIAVDRVLPDQIGDASIADRGLTTSGDVTLADWRRTLPAEDALNLYLERGRDEGRVLREAPTRLLIDSRPLDDGEGYEVTYVRQIVERAIVPELYAPQGTDDTGRAVLTRYEPRSPRAF